MSKQQGCKTFAEDARVRAVRLACQEGWKPSDVAQALGCSTRSVQSWVKNSERGRKPAALKTKKAPGMTPKLDVRQKKRLLKLLERGPEAAGFTGQLWTGPRVGELIRREFGVTYHVQYLPSLLRALGWSPQKPKRQAMERNQETIDAWVAKVWPRIKKRLENSAPRSSFSIKPAF
jgi:transposase